MKRKWLRFLTKLVKPCHFFRVAKTPKGDYLHCEYDGSYRHKCRIQMPALRADRTV